MYPSYFKHYLLEFYVFLMQNRINFVLNIRGISIVKKLEQD